MNEAGYDMVISRHDEWILDFCELLRGGQSPILCRMKYDSFCSEIQGVPQLSSHFVFVILLASTHPNCKSWGSFTKFRKFATK